MRVIISAVCDHAWVENGCLSLFRAFDSINVGSFPFTLSRISVALRVLVGRAEHGRHVLSIVMSDSEGKRLMNNDINVDLKPTAESLPEAAFSFSLNGQNVVFDKPGEYKVEILIDGRIESAVPLYVVKHKNPDSVDIPDRI